MKKHKKLGTKLLSLTLATVMAVAAFPETAFALETDGISECHLAHDENCGYIAMAEESPCSHTCELCEGEESGDNIEIENGGESSNTTPECVRTVKRVVTDAKSTPTRTTRLDVSNMTTTTDMLNSEGWKWVPAAGGGTLTLRNCYIQVQEAHSLHLPDGNVTIMLEGENTIETMSTAFNAMIRSDGAGGVAALNLTIAAGTEDGKLNILRNNTSGTMSPYAIAGNTTTIQSGDIYANTEFCIIKSNFTMQGGSLKIDAANISDGNGIYSLEGNVNISGGNLDINAGQIGIYIPGNTNTGEQKVSLTGGDVKIRGGIDGITAKNITIDTDGNIDLQGSRNALYCSETGGTLEILSAGSLTLAGTNLYLPTATGNGKTVTIGPADYTKVEAAIAKIPSDLSIYTADSVKALNDAKNAVVRNKNIIEQTIVDGYVTAIEDALINLKKKPVISITNPETGTKVEYEDGTLFDSSIVLNVISKPQAEMDKIKDNIDKAAPGFVLGGLYEIKLLKDGVAIQPDSKVKVSIPLNEAMKTMTDLKVVYIDDNGKVTIIPSEVKDGMIIFATDHFSDYGVIGKVKATDPGNNNGSSNNNTDSGNNNTDSGNTNSPQTGDSLPVLLFVLMMLASGTALVILTQKRRIFKQNKK